MATASMTTVMDGIAALLVSAAFCDNNYAWPADSVTAPCTIVGYPSRIEFDGTMARGMDTWTFPIWYVVGKTNTKDARNRLSTIINDTTSVKSVLDGAQSFGSVRVTTAEVTEITVGAVALLAVKFEAEVI